MAQIFIRLVLPLAHCAPPTVRKAHVRLEPVGDSALIHVRIVRC